MECIFCRIIKGELPSYLIYEDNLFKVFLDINPITNGHTLVVPKKHYKNVLDIPDELINNMNKITKKIYKQYKEKLGILGMTLVQNNEYGQDIKHYHLHLIPRYSDDEFTCSSNKKILIPLPEIINKINN